MYKSALLTFLEALTPVHVGTGREEALHVDLPVQRDEFGFPTIWASSLKGAIKANIKDANFRRHLGSEPDEPEARPSHITILDAKLLLIPARTLDNVWTYVTTPHLLGYLKTYLEVYRDITGSQLALNLASIEQVITKGVAISTKFSERVFINETEVEVTQDANLLTKLGLDKILPESLKNSIAAQGLVVIPDKDNKGLAIIRKSMMIQYRVRLKREEKTVDAGPWSEEYMPTKTVLISIALCRDVQEKSSVKSAKDLCEEFKSKIGNKSIYIGGKETIGRGLVKIYTG